MPRKTYTPEQIIGKLRQIEVLIAQLSALFSQDWLQPFRFMTIGRTLGDFSV